MYYLWFILFIFYNANAFSGEKILIGEPFTESKIDFFKRLPFPQEISFENLPFNNAVKEKILKGEVYSESVVENFGEVPFITQSLKFSIAGLHPKSCEFALRKLSLYEDFSHYLDFVKISKYDQVEEEIDFSIEHSLVPFPFHLTFKLPRIRTVGQYPFMLRKGLFKDLAGMIYVIDYKNRCLFYTTASWFGPHTGYPGILIEVFSQTLSRISMERLFRMSESLGK